MVPPAGRKPVGHLVVPGEVEFDSDFLPPIKITRTQLGLKTSYVLY